MNHPFNIRVYGLLIHDKKILVSDEQQFGLQFTKFPGGGLEYGEGTIDCLKREFSEELGIDIQVGELAYLTDFFQLSDFADKSQIISVYYHVSTKNPEHIPVTATAFDFSQHDEEVHRWLPISELNEDIFQFPIDKVVVKHIQRTHALD